MFGKNKIAIYGDRCVFRRRAEFREQGGDGSVAVMLNFFAVYSQKHKKLSFVERELSPMRVTPFRRY
jgi:hypothetical protein